LIFQPPISPSPLKEPTSPTPSKGKSPHTKPTSLSPSEEKLLQTTATSPLQPQKYYKRPPSPSTPSPLKFKKKVARKLVEELEAKPPNMRVNIPIVVLTELGFKFKCGK